jgi:hypothetical protein
MKLSKVAIAIVCIFAAREADAQPVLTEIFTNTACTNCITPDNDFDKYIKKNPNVESIFFHTDFPSPTDIFYKTSKTTADYTITTFYNVQADPQAFVNGLDAGIKFSDWQSAIESASTSYEVTVKIKVAQIQKGAAISVDLSGNSAGKTVLLFVALTESNINYDNKGSFGNPEQQPIWNNVFRRMLPNSDGSGSVSFVLSGDKHFDMTFDTTGTGWNIKNMRAIAFVQEENPTQGDAPIQGLSAISLSPLGISPAVANNIELGTAMPNPFNGSTSLPLNLKSASKVRVTIVNELGTEFTLTRDHEVSAGATMLRRCLSSTRVRQWSVRGLTETVAAGRVGYW